MGAATTTSRAPDARFLLAHPAHFIALGFGAGLAPRAPGTAGTLAALALYWLLALALPPLAIAFVAIPLFFVGVWACGRAGLALGDHDHGALVWDEIVAFLPLAAFAHLAAQTIAQASKAPFPGGDLALLALWQLAAFALFRLFDIWKPFPIRELDRRLEGGFGVMFDDLVAAAYAYVLLFALAIAWHELSP